MWSSVKELSEKYWPVSGRPAAHPWRRLGMATGEGAVMRPKSPQVVWPLWSLGQGSFLLSLPFPCPRVNIVNGHH